MSQLGNYIVHMPSIYTTTAYLNYPFRKAKRAYQLIAPDCCFTRAISKVIPSLLVIVVNEYELERQEREHAIYYTSLAITLPLSFIPHYPSLPSSFSLYPPFLSKMANNDSEEIKILGISFMKRLDKWYMVNDQNMQFC